MATINNKTDRTFVVHGLGTIEPGINTFAAARVEAFEQLSGKKLSSLESDAFEVKATKKKGDD